MMFRGLFLLVMFMFTNSVSCKDVNDTKEVRKGKAVDTSYPFNHPPLTEYYNPIPVAVVYEDDRSGYSERSEITTESVKSNENIEVKVENLQTTTTEREGTTIAAKTIVTKTKEKFITKPRSLSDFQIPVAVIYESGYNNNHLRMKMDTNTRIPKRHVSYGRTQQIKANADTPYEQTTQISNVETEKPLLKNIDTRTIKKRTGGRDPVVPIIEYENYVFSHRGNFRYRYESGDGTMAYSEGKLKTLEDEPGEAVVGGFSYTDNDGNDFSISYTADENGYRPVGSHLPTPPPIPPQIARALKYLATATPEPVTKRPMKSKLLTR